MHKLTLNIVILVLGLVGSFSLSGQQANIYLRNGKKLAIKEYKLDSSNYYEGKLNYVNLKGKEKDKYLEDVFSVVDSDGKEHILYQQNIEFGELLTPEEMKQYTIGIGDARIAKISPLIAIGGVASGLVGAFIPKPEISLDGSTMEIPIGILVPVAYVGIIGATPPSADKLKERLPDYANNEHYLMGYQEGQKKKRIKHSLIGAGFGFVAGVLIYGAVN